RKVRLMVLNGVVEYPRLHNEWAGVHQPVHTRSTLATCGIQHEPL
ncbi:hypothetical protein TNCV_4719291, partial [Trichonephila clavipes]